MSKTGAAAESVAGAPVGARETAGAVDGHLRIADAIGAALRQTWTERLIDGADCPTLEVAAALAMLGPIHDIDWWDEADGLPEGGGFVLDLADRPSEQGGLLLAPAGDGAVTGWRPQAGALTAFEAAAMLLSPVRPGAAQRLAIVGRLG